MIEIDELDLTPEYRKLLDDWATVLGVSVPVLVARIIVATIYGFLYIEKIPDYYPDYDEIDK